MTVLNDDQINSLDKNAMTFIIKTLQEQLALLETTNKKLIAQFGWNSARYASRCGITSDGRGLYLVLSPFP